MKNVIILLFVCLTCFPLFSQVNTEIGLSIKEIEKYQKRKNAGALLIVGGSILSAIGTVTILNSSIIFFDEGNRFSADTEGKPITGATLYFLGHAALGTGILLFINGKTNMSKSSGIARGVSLRLRLGKNYNGVSLSCKL